MKKILLLVALLAIASTKAWSGQGSYKVRKSSIKNCKSVKSDEMAEILQCPAFQGMNVFVEVMDMYSGLLIQHQKTKYNIVEMINEVPAGKCTVGAFTYISGNEIQWLYSGKTLKGLMVQVSGTDILDEEQKEVSSNCVISINERKHSSILGLASNLKEASELLSRAE